MTAPAPDSLHCGDCLDVLRGWPDGCVDLAYIDPPFNTGRTQRGGRRSSRAAEGARFADAYGDAAGYIEYMRPRVAELRRVLAPCGSLWYHCDWHASHHVRLLLDELFGAERFVNEVIWRYGLGAARGQRHFRRKHDTLYLYGKTAGYTFNALRGEPSAAQEAKYRHTDARGRYMLSYGRRYYFQGGAVLDDVWDIPALAATSGERCGWPTQKPLALLERIVAASSEPGALVLDAFCGSGTTLVAAQRLGRRWVGIDASAAALEQAHQRLAGAGASSAEPATP